MASSLKEWVSVLIVVVDAGGGVDASDAGPRAGVVAVRVGGVVARVSVVSRDLAPWFRRGRAGSTWLPCMHSPHQLAELDGHVAAVGKPAPATVPGISASCGKRSPPRRSTEDEPQAIAALLRHPSMRMMLTYARISDRTVADG